MDMFRKTRSDELFLLGEFLRVDFPPVILGGGGFPILWTKNL